QISHLFGRTKNPFLFNCAWNIAYVPKYLDPFTGHETQGEYSNEFKNMFTPIINEKFRQYIIEYNELISNLLPIIDDALKLTKENLKIPANEFKNID
ncbi:hypothetical protein, partial [Flavobacterium psychrophilum]